jgi:hypothetical protein
VGFIALDFGARQFHYNDRVTNGTLRPYDLPEGILFPIAPGLSASAELYPLATSDLGVLRDVGVSFAFLTNFAKARVADTILATRWYAWDADLRARFHTGPRGRSTVIGASLGIGQSVFHFRDAGIFEALLPDVDYRYARAAVNARLPVGGRWALTGGAAYRHLLSTGGPNGGSILAAGSVGEHFPQAKMAGVDVDGGVALALSGQLEARLVVDYARYWAHLHPAVGSAYVAGGAVDQMLHARVGVAATF